MLPSNVIRYITAAGISFVWLDSHFAEPFKNLVLSRSEVRLYKEKHPHQQLIAVHNAGSKAAEPIAAKAELPIWALADFRCGPSPDYSAVSFWSLVSESDLGTLGFRSGKPGSAFLDRHYDKSGLDSYWDASRAVLRASLIHEGHSAAEVDNLLSSERAHTEWLGRCSQDKVAPKPLPNCAIEDRVEAIEMSERRVLHNAANSWREATGVRVDFSPSDASPNFLFIPEGHHSYYLSFQYGKATKSATISFPLPTEEIQSSGFWQRLLRRFRDTPIWVDNREDLQASAWRILWRYQIKFLILGLVVIASCLIASRPGLTAVSRMATHEVFNLALRTIGTANDKEWAAAYERVTPDLSAEFARHVAALGKPCPNVSRPQLFAGIRRKMTIDYGKGALYQFVDQLHLDEAVHRYLDEMAQAV